MEKDIEIICKYKYLSTEYMISIINKDELLFSKIDDGKINNKLSLKEIYIATSVLDSLVINEDCSVFIRKIKVGKKIYKLYFDKKNRLYWWISDSGQISKEDNLYLNKKYNDMRKIIYLDRKKNNDHNKGNIVLRRIINNTLIPILFNVFALSTVYTGGVLLIRNIENYKYTMEYVEALDEPEIRTYKDIKELELEIELEEKKRDQKANQYREELKEDNTYSWEKIKSAIETNENLTRRGKRFFI